MTPPASPTDRAHRDDSGAGAMIMALLLVALGMGLAAILAFYYIMRARAPQWPPPGTPALPQGLWLSTAIILCSSVTIHAAVVAARRNRQPLLRGLLLATLALALGFIVSQVVNWGLAVAAQMPPGLNMYAVTFYLLTGLHAAHVLGGAVALALVTARAFSGRYSPARHAGVTYCAAYWHFVDAVWLVMFGSLLLGG